jgi:pyruvate formate lyase activating enzyme
MQQEFHKALWWDGSGDSGDVKCFLCPRNCLITNGKTGFCNVRKNIDGVLYSLSYGYPVALQVDPIEKKPLARFMSGSRTFSLGTYGCNLACSFCQNHHLSRGHYRSFQENKYASPELIVEIAQKQKCESIAFTYNEPTVFAEYAMDIAVLAKQAGLATVLVSNGYISLDAAKEFYPLIDAANIDMKGFSEDFYGKMTGGNLQSVLESIKLFYDLGKHLELTNLIIPGKNDDPEMIHLFLDWVEQNLDKNVPIHFSAYHPDYKYDASPRTDPNKLLSILDLAVERDFKHIFLGNIWRN